MAKALYDKGREYALDNRMRGVEECSGVTKKEIINREGERV